MPRSDADEFEHLIPNSRKVLFEDTGHTAMIERPPTFNNCLLEFLDEDAAPARPEAEVEAASAG